MSDQVRLLRGLADLVNGASLEKRSAVLRATEAALSSLDTSVSLPLAAQWFLENRTASGEPDAAEDFWASRITFRAAEELRELVPRFVVLHGEHRRCSLVGNTGAEWGYCALALLPTPPDHALQPRLLEQLFEQVAAANTASDLQSVRICAQAFRHAPPDAVLRVLYEHEHPDWRLGHSMMRLEIDDDDVVTYWPGLEDSEFNHVDREVLAEICERLALRHVLPLQLAAFLTVLTNATADHTESWGAERGIYFFQEGNIPYMLRQLPEEADD